MPLTRLNSALKPYLLENALAGTSMYKWLQSLSDRYLDNWTEDD
jgi:hypothetical protein